MGGEARADINQPCPGAQEEHRSPSWTLCLGANAYHDPRAWEQPPRCDPRAWEQPRMVRNQL